MPQFTHYLPTPQLTLLIVTNAHMHFKKRQWHLSLPIFSLFLPPQALLSSHGVKLDAVIKLSGASLFLSGFGVSIFLVPLELDIHQEHLWDWVQLVLHCNSIFDFLLAYPCQEGLQIHLLSNWGWYTNFITLFLVFCLLYCVCVLESFTQ